MRFACAVATMFIVAAAVPEVAVLMASYAPQRLPEVFVDVDQVSVQSDALLE